MDAPSTNRNLTSNGNSENATPAAADDSGTLNVNVNPPIISNSLSPSESQNEQVESESSKTNSTSSANHSTNIDINSYRFLQGYYDSGLTSRYQDTLTKVENRNKEMNEWDIFISYHQQPSQLEVALLREALEASSYFANDKQVLRIWCDLEMEASAANTVFGVQHSKLFVLMLNSTVLTRSAVQLEIKTALLNNIPIRFIVNGNLSPHEINELFSIRMLASGSTTSSTSSNSSSSAEKEILFPADFSHLLQQVKEYGVITFFPQYENLMNKTVAEIRRNYREVLQLPTEMFSLTTTTPLGSTRFRMRKPLLSPIDVSIHNVYNSDDYSGNSNILNTLSTSSTGSNVSLTNTTVGTLQETPASPVDVLIIASNTAHGLCQANLFRVAFSYLCSRRNLVISTLFENINDNLEANTILNRVLHASYYVCVLTSDLWSNANVTFALSCIAENISKSSVIFGTNKMPISFILETNKAYEGGSFTSVVSSCDDFNSLSKIVKDLVFSPIALSLDRKTFTREAIFNKLLVKMGAEYTNKPQGLCAPPPVSPNFMYEPVQNVIDEIVKKFCNSEMGTQQVRAISINGFGGIGKSSIATAIAHHRTIQYNYHDIFWLSIGRTNDNQYLLQKLRTLIEELDVWVSTKSMTNNDNHESVRNVEISERPNQVTKTAEDSEKEKADGDDKNSKPDNRGSSKANNQPSTSENRREKVDNYGTSTPETLDQAMYSLHKRLQLRKCLVIVDDIWTTKQVEPFLKSILLSSELPVQSKILFTTRNVQLRPVGDQLLHQYYSIANTESFALNVQNSFLDISVDKLSPDNSTKMLLTTSKLNNAHVKEAISNSTIQNILEYINYSPLPIAMVGSIISTRFGELGMDSLRSRIATLQNIKHALQDKIVSTTVMTPKSVSPTRTTWTHDLGVENVYYAQAEYLPVYRTIELLMETTFTPAEQKAFTVLSLFLEDDYIHEDVLSILWRMDKISTQNFIKKLATFGLLKIEVVDDRNNGKNNQEDTIANSYITISGNVADLQDRIQSISYKIMLHDLTLDFAEYESRRLVRVNQYSRSFLHYNFINRFSQRLGLPSNEEYYGFEAGDTYYTNYGSISGDAVETSFTLAHQIPLPLSLTSTNRNPRNWLVQTVDSVPVDVSIQNYIIEYLLRHLFEAHLYEELLTVFKSFDWISSHLKSFGYISLKRNIDLYVLPASQYLSNSAEKEGYELLAKSVILSGSVISDTQYGVQRLASQLLGRCSHLEELHLNVYQSLLASCRQWCRNNNALEPHSTCFTYAGGETEHILMDHRRRVAFLGTIRRIVFVDNGGTLSSKETKTIDYIISGGYDKRIILWNSDTFLAEREYLGHRHGITKVLQLDNDHFISASIDGTLRIWNIELNNSVAVLKAHSTKIDISTDEEVTTNYHNAADASGIKCMCLCDPMQHVSISMKIPYVIAATYGGKIHIWDIKSISTEILPVQTISLNKLETNSGDKAGILPDTVSFLEQIELPRRDNESCEYGIISVSKRYICIWKPLDAVNSNRNEDPKGCSHSDLKHVTCFSIADKRHLCDHLQDSRAIKSSSAVALLSSTKIAVNDGYLIFTWDIIDSNNPTKNDSQILNLERFFQVSPISTHLFGSGMLLYLDNKRLVCCSSYYREILVVDMTVPNSANQLWTNFDTVTDYNHPRINVLRGHYAAITCCAIVDNTQFVTGSADYTVILWDSTQVNPLKQIKGHFYIVYSLTTYRNSLNNTCYVLSGARDFTMRITNIAAINSQLLDKLDKMLPGHQLLLRDIKNWNKNSSRLLSIGDDCTIRSWNIIDHNGNLQVIMNDVKKLYESESDTQGFLIKRDNRIRTMLPLPDHNRVIVGTVEGNLYSFSIDENGKFGEPIIFKESSPSNSSEVLQLIELSNGWIISATEDKNIRLWDVNSKDEPFEVIAFPQIFSPVIAINDLQTNMQTIPDHPSPHNSASFLCMVEYGEHHMKEGVSKSKRGLFKYTVSKGMNSDYKAEIIIKIPNLHKEHVTAISCSPNGRYVIYISSSDKSIVIYDLITETTRKSKSSSFLDRTNSIGFVEENCRYVITSGKYLTLWDIETISPVRILNEVYSHYIYNIGNYYVATMTWQRLMGVWDFSSLKDGNIKDIHFVELWRLDSKSHLLYIPEQDAICIRGEHYAPVLIKINRKSSKDQLVIQN